MYPERFGVWQAINNELFGSVDGDILLPSMKGLRRHLYARIRALGLTPVGDLTFQTESQASDYFIRNQTVVLGETMAVAIPIPW